MWFEFNILVTQDDGISIKSKSPATFSITIVKIYIKYCLIYKYVTHFYNCIWRLGYIIL